MNALFRGGPRLKVITRNGIDCGLLEFKELVVEEDDGTLTRYGMEPTGSLDGDTDGASIPGLAELVSMILGLDLQHTGDYWPGAVLHDFIFRRKLVQWLNGAWVKLTYVEFGADPKKGEMDFARANAIFKAIMFGLGTDSKRSFVIIEALSVAGKKAWDEDAALAA